MSGISFSIKKKEGSGFITDGSAPLTRQAENEAKTDFVLSLEGREINSTLPKTEKRELIIPMIGKNKWRTSASQSKKPEEANSQQPTSTGANAKSSEELQLEKEAAEAVIKDLQETRAAATKIEDELIVPLLLQNQPPVVEGREKDDLADVDLRPEQSTLDEYDSVPIESYGAAMLKGMGWKKGTAIGLSNKGLIEPIEFIPRLGGLGLGATPKAPPPDPKRRIKKPGEEKRKIQGPYVDKDGRVKHYKKVGEEIPDQPLQGFVVGNYARVLKGPHKNLSGKIVSVDEDTARVVLKMAINGQYLGFSQHYLELVSREESSKTHTHGSSGRGEASSSGGSQEKQYGLVTKGDRSSRQEPPSKRVKHDTDEPSSKHVKHDTDEPSSKRVKHDTDDRSSWDRSKPIQSSRHSYQSKEPTGDRHRHHEASSRHSDKLARSQGAPDPVGSRGSRDARDRYLSKEQQLSVSRERSWLYPHLRVRMIDQKYSKGKYYNTKVIILDVISLGECVCQTESGKLLEGVTEAMLETVIPRLSGSKVMIVSGANKGKIATILEQERHKARAVVEISLNKKVLQVDFDDICEYTGQTDDDI